MFMKSTADILGDFKRRTNFTMKKIANGMGYKNSSGVQRYFDSKGRKKKYLPADLVEKIEELFLGQGQPPISKDEIWQLAGQVFQKTASTPDNAPIKVFENKTPAQEAASLYSHILDLCASLSPEAQVRLDVDRLAHDIRDTIGQAQSPLKEQKKIKEG
jgi:hypothetical protein